MEQTSSTAGASAFASELQLRVAEAEASLAAADAMDDPLLAQIAEADLADLRSLAARNDVELAQPAGEPAGG
jgi:hypothetical protein